MLRKIHSLTMKNTEKQNKTKIILNIQLIIIFSLHN